MEWIIGGILILCFILGTSILFWRMNNLDKKMDSELNNDEIYTPPPIYVDTEGLERKIKDVPNKVLQSIQGSINTHKGAVGELIGYIELRGRYDRIIPLGNIVDFICIRFPTDKEEGTVDFVDVKTGGSSRLNKDQKSLQCLIDEKKIGFIKLKVTDNKIA